MQDLKLSKKEIFQIRPILSPTLDNGSGVYFFASCASLTDTMEQNIFKSSIKDDVITVVCRLYTFLLFLKLFEKEIFQIRPKLSLTLNNGSGVYFFDSCAQ